jgi:hypothetical protein
MQHLGHLWEKSGPLHDIDAALWLAVATFDDTTPGTALIALSRGYERHGQARSLAKVQQQALILGKGEYRRKLRSRHKTPNCGNENDISAKWVIKSVRIDGN